MISVDPANHMVVLQRTGAGSGPSADDARGLQVTVNGKTARTRIDPGPSRWSGQTILRDGIVLSDEILLERPVTISGELATFSGDERVYTLLTSAPPLG